MDEIIRAFTLRLTPEQHELLERGAKEENISKNQFIIRLLENYEVASRTSYLAGLQKTMEDSSERIKALELELADAVEALKILGIAPEEVDDQEMEKR